VVSGSTARVCGGVVLVLALGAVCGLINGCVVVFGRLQPIITTLATGSSDVVLPLTENASACISCWPC
jgi:ribose transport system permease protein